MFFGVKWSLINHYELKEENLLLNHHTGWEMQSKPRPPYKNANFRYFINYVFPAKNKW